jgi:hypothetical protein
MKIQDLPMSPPFQYDQLSGKRPDLLLGPVASAIGSAVEDPVNVPPGRARRMFGIFAADGCPPLMIFVGSTN